MAKFCTKCGRPLEEEEICQCVSLNKNNQQVPPSVNPGYQQAAPNGNPGYQQVPPNGNPGYQQAPPNMEQGFNDNKAEWANEKKDAFVAGTKSMIGQIGPIIKKPITTARQMISGERPAVGMQLIITKAVILLVVALVFVAATLGEYSQHLNILYFKIIVSILIFTAGVDILEAYLMKTFTGLFGGTTTLKAMLTTIGIRGLFDTGVLVISLILMMFSGTIGLIAFVLLGLVLQCIQLSVFHASVEAPEDKKPYIYFIAKAVITIIVYVLIYILVKDLVQLVMANALGGLSSLY